MEKNIKTTILIVVLLLGIAQVSFAQDFYKKTTRDTIQNILTSTINGGEIALQEGSYGPLSLRHISGSKEKPLIIKSADRNRPAKFTGFFLDDAHNIVLEDLVFDYTFRPGDPPHLRPFEVSSSENIIIRSSIFDGDVARDSDSYSNGFGNAYGLSINESQNIFILGNKISGFLRGIVINNSKNIKIERNELEGMRSDGMNLAQVEGAEIIENYIHDFKVSNGSRDHGDMIQVWTNGTSSPTSDIRIENNILSSGLGRYTQSIFMRNDLVDRGLAGKEMYYRNITIEGNLIINAHLHGITVGETIGLLLKNNTIVRNATSAGIENNISLWTPKIGVARDSMDVTIANNVVSKITGYDGQSDWKVVDNFFVQDTARMEPGFYGHVFTKKVLKDQTNFASFAPLIGGPLDNTGIGSPILGPSE